MPCDVNYNADIGYNEPLTNYNGCTNFPEIDVTSMNFSVGFNMQMNFEGGRVFGKKALGPSGWRMDSSRFGGRR